MCAICGILGKEEKVDERIINKMMRTMAHRGPDDDGIVSISIFNHCFEDLTVGFNRLSIRDLSNNGHQPMYNLERNIFITFNGEIYNSNEIKRSISEKEHVFNGTSDTEVLLYLYEKYGIDKTLNMIDGMYAICIVDLKKKVIYLVRDKLGEKPLYIYENSKMIMWASEYKAFYCNPQFKAELNANVITEYLMFRYISGEETLLKDVYNLVPGTYLEITNNFINRVIYWEYGDVKVNKKISKKSIMETTEMLIKKSLKRRLISDVPVGIQLSGGVDSSLLCCYVKELTDTEIQTFGIVFTEEDYSEKKYMDQVNRQYHFMTNEYLFEDVDFEKLWMDTTFFFEAPMNHPGTLGLLYLNYRAKKKVTVMLCGEGADETCGGYYEFPLIAFLKKYPFSAFVRNLVHKIKYGKNNKIMESTDVNFIRMTQRVDDMFVKKIYPNADIKSCINRRLDILKHTLGKGMHHYLNYYAKTYLKDILMRADKASMAASVELRVPYLMPELVDFLCSVPSKYLVRPTVKKASRKSKMLYKRLALKIFDESFVYRDKIGFGVPIYFCFMNESTKDYIEKKVLVGLTERGLFEAEYIRGLWRKIKESSSDELKRHSDIIELLWTVFSFEIWLEMYIDNSPVEYVSSIIRNI